MEVLSVEHIETVQSPHVEDDKPRVVDVDVDDPMPSADAERKEQEEQLRKELFAKKIAHTPRDGPAPSKETAGTHMETIFDSSMEGEGMAPTGMAPTEVAEKCDEATPRVGTVDTLDVSSTPLLGRVPTSAFSASCAGDNDRNNYIGTDDVSNLHNRDDLNLQNSVAAGGEEAGGGGRGSGVSSDKTPTIVTTSTFARVSFIGWLEWTDEWIDISSDRLAPLNSMSGGGRGDFHVRDEVKFLAKFWEKKWIYSNSLEGMYRQRCAESTNTVLVSPVFANVVQHFGSMNGFVQLCLVLREAGYNPRFPMPVDGDPPQRHLNTSCCIDLVTAVGMAGEVLTRGLLVNLSTTYSTDLVECAQQALIKLMPSPDLRSVTTEAMERLVESMMQLQLTISADEVPCAKLMDEVYVYIILHCLNSDFLNR